MNHELIMLREVKRVYKLSQSLTKEVRYRAVKSHMTYNVKNGTLGQIEEICQLVQLRDDCLLFCLALRSAMDKMDSDKRRLLRLYYLKGVDFKTITARLNLSESAVYNKLYQARLQLRKILTDIGYDAQWLKDRFSHINCIADRLKQKQS